MRPLSQQRLEFINKCNCIVDYELLEKAMIWLSTSTLKKKRVIYLHAKYPCVSIYDRKIHIHRLLKSYQLKRSLKREEYVHHKDENKLNAMLSNLEIQPMSDHQSLHNSGKVLSSAHRFKISEANRKRKGVNTKKRTDITIEGINEMLNKGLNISDISKHFNCGWSTIKKIIHEKTETK